MSLRLDLWAISGKHLSEIPTHQLDLEDRLEDWLARDPSVTGMDVLIVGRQVVTDQGGRIDLLAIDRDAHTVVFELKRGRTPRDVVAQVLDYAMWVKDLSYAWLDDSCRGFHGKSLAEAYAEFFDDTIPETVNADHSLVIVAAELDDSSERIVRYLADERGLRINVVFFNVFKLGDREILGRAWLKDPEVLEEQAEARQRAPWSGYWFVNVGEGPHRTWVDNVRYGFVGAGGGEKYSKPLRKLHSGDKIFAYMKGLGYVGYGEVLADAVPIDQFMLSDGGGPLLEQELQAERLAEHVGDPRTSEWCVAVRWDKTVQREDARTFKGVFANQNIVCKLRHPETVQFVEREFGVKEAQS